MRHSFVFRVLWSLYQQVFCHCGTANSAPPDRGEISCLKRDIPVRSRAYHAAPAQSQDPHDTGRLDRRRRLWQGWRMTHKDPQIQAPAPAPHHHTATDRRALMASGGIVLGGALWGFYWLPVRYLGAAGLDGPWAGAAIYLATVVLLLPLIVWRARAIMGHWRALAVCGMLTGAAFSFYSTSLLMTEVVRSILLFYLTPIWGTFLGMAFLGERLTRGRAGALVLAFAGLVVIMGPGGAFSRAPNGGDYLALASGVAWALGSFQVFRLKQVPVTDLVIAFAVGSLVVTGLTLLSGIGAPAPLRPLATLGAAAPMALAVAVYVIPMLALTVWPATVLNPGRIGLLLMSDAVVGIASAAALSGEPFGWREAAGTALIISAAAVEVLVRTPAQPVRDQISSPDI